MPPLNEKNLNSEIETGDRTGAHSAEKGSLNEKNLNSEIETVVEYATISVVGQSLNEKNLNSEIETPYMINHRIAPVLL